MDVEHAGWFRRTRADLGIIGMVAVGLYIVGLLALVVGPITVGIVLSASIGPWQWWVSGLVVSITMAALPATLMGLADVASDSVASFVVLVVAAICALGFPGGLVAWLWSGDARWAWGLAGPVVALLLVVGAAAAEDDAWHHDRRPW